VREAMPNRHLTRPEHRMKQGSPFVERLSRIGTRQINNMLSNSTAIDDQYQPTIQIVPEGGAKNRLVKYHNAPNN
jgi:hypothetical protein